MSTEPLFTDLLENQPLKPQKAIAYVDGFNLYYGISDLRKPRLKWLDIKKLCEFIAQQYKNVELIKIKYFTAMVKDKEKQKRQIIYLDALKSTCDNLEIIKGKFLSHNYRCYNCENFHVKYEEKQTDVNIACHLLTDALEEQIDTAIIISADSDLIPPIKILRQRHKNVFVWTPPCRNSDELKENADKYFSIFESTINKCLLPDEIILKTGYKLKRPTEWSNKK